MIMNAILKLKPKSFKKTSAHHMLDYFVSHAVFGGPYFFG